MQRLGIVFLLTAVCFSPMGIGAQQQPAKAKPRHAEGQPRRPPEPAKLPGPIAPEFKPLRVAPHFEPIVNPPVIDAGEVTDQVGGTELVLAVVVAGKARAYPINMLTGPVREIINDQLSGRAIAQPFRKLGK